MLRAYDASMRTPVEPSPLAVAALAFVDHGTTPSALAGRFAALDAPISERTAEALLDELNALGLARVVRGHHGDGHYFRTPLGARLVAASFAGRKEHVELLAELELMRTDLVSTIAHELRTPLTAVRTSVSLLLDPSLEPSAIERRKLLLTIDRNATRMQRVVGDILDLSRFRVGAVQLQLRRFDAVHLGRSAIASVAPLAATKGQSVELTAPTEPVLVFGDYRRLEQALVNLLSNAQKHSPDGTSIVVSVTTDRTEVSLTVTDHGTGIDAADKDRLFERFFVSQHDRAESTGGVGLGLPIALAITQAHEGRIDVSSQPGVGSSFSIVVPAAGPAEVQSE